MVFLLMVDQEHDVNIFGFESSVLARILLHPPLSVWL